jgi:hypothetical protein
MGPAWFFLHIGSLILVLPGLWYIIRVPSAPPARAPLVSLAIA